MCITCSSTRRLLQPIFLSLLIGYFRVRHPYVPIHTRGFEQSQSPLADSQVLADEATDPEPRSLSAQTSSPQLLLPPHNRCSFSLFLFLPTAKRERAMPFSDACFLSSTIETFYLTTKTRYIVFRAITYVY